MISKRGVWKEGTRRDQEEIQGDKFCLDKPAIRYKLTRLQFLNFFHLCRRILNVGGNLNTYTNQLQKNVSPAITSKV